MLGGFHLPTSFHPHPALLCKKAGWGEKEVVRWKPPCRWLLTEVSWVSPNQGERDCDGATKHRLRDQHDIWLGFRLRHLLGARKMQIIKLTFHITREQSITLANCTRLTCTRAKPMAPLAQAILNCVFDSSQDVCHHNIDFHLCDEGYVYSQSWRFGNSALWGHFKLSL